MLPIFAPGSARLHRWERGGLMLFALALVAFGALVEWRSAFQQQRKTDFGVYARAAFAVRSGEDVYDVHDDNGWHYPYPAAFAIAMIPLADPWPWMDRTGYLPYALSVAIWFVLSVGFAAYATHALARVADPTAVPGSRRWWYARTAPTYICLGAIGTTLARGQVNTLLLALIAGMFTAMMAGKRMRSGAWLAAAITLKIIPAVLLLIPFVRRDGRTGVGLAVGLVAGLLVIPTLALGWEKAVDANDRVFNSVLRPATTGGGDTTRAKELTGITATDNQSFAAIVHTIRHPDRAERPIQADRLTKMIHLGIAGSLALICLWVGWRGVGPHPADQLIYFGCVAMLMMLMSPVTHMHYYTFALPLVSGLWARSLASRPNAVFADGKTLALLAIWGATTGAVLFPVELLREARSFGVCTAMTLVMWAYGLFQITQKPLSVVEHDQADSGECSEERGPFVVPRAA
ncbi:MAG: DUF2029 domain-containing protein [Bacteroidales bacterium]|nr:DUF2029 domain-containing protein [Bacteroidales bacterium]